MAKSLVWLCAEKLRRLRFDNRGTPRRVKRKRIMNSKVEFSEKLRNSFGERGYEKLAAKVSMFLARCHANNLAKKENQTGDPGSIYTKKL